MPWQHCQRSGSLLRAPASGALPPQPIGRHWWRLAALLPLLLLAITADAETLLVGGTGSSAPIVRLLFDEFRQQDPEATLRQLAPPIGTGGALKALAGGRIDLGVIGRPLLAAEMQQVGEHFPLADSPFVFASRDGQQDGGFTLDQLASIHDGRLRSWQDGSPIRLILRASFESDTLTLKNMSPAMAEAVVAATRRPGMVYGDNDFHALQLIATTPGSLGPTTLGMIVTTQTRVVVLAIDGVAPSLRTLQDGSYPWCKSLTVVLPQRASPLARRFAAFLRSAAAARVLQEHAYLPRMP